MRSGKWGEYEGGGALNPPLQDFLISRCSQVDIQHTLRQNLLSWKHQNVV